MSGEQLTDNAARYRLLRMSRATWEITPRDVEDLVGGLRASGLIYEFVTNGLLSLAPADPEKPDRGEVFRWTSLATYVFKHFGGEL